MTRLTESRIDTLRLLARGPMERGRIREVLDLSHSGTWYVLHGLTSVGLAVREPGRVPIYRLTPRGAAALSAHDTALRARRSDPPPTVKPSGDITAAPSLLARACGPEVSP